MSRPAEMPKLRKSIVREDDTGNFVNNLGTSSPSTVTTRLSRGSRWYKLLTGELTVADLNDEEISRGRVMSSRGRFDGPMPKMVPATLVEAMRNETYRRVQDRWRENLAEAQLMLLQMARDPSIDAGTRAKLLIYMIERTIGKIPDKVEVQAALKPWEKVFDEVLIDRSRPIIEGAVVEDMQAREKERRLAAIEEQQAREAELTKNSKADAPIIRVDHERTEW